MMSLDTLSLTLHRPHPLGLDQLELHAPAGPGDGPAVGGVLQESDEELPELERSPSGGDREMSVVVRGWPARQSEHCNKGNMS